MITINNLNYSYRTFEKSVGIKGSLRDFFKRKYSDSVALNNINFNISKGEIVGLVGPNGSGKTTLIKIMTGILHPSNGSVKCLEYIPYEKEHDYLKKIGVVLGQKSQLIWDLPATETMELLRVIYQIDTEKYNVLSQYLCDQFRVAHKINTPVRKLSLGERIKFEIICALLHSPDILFLDEPTIGLDLESQKAVRKFLKSVNEEMGVTIIITSHYMRDIEELCQRVIFLKEGTLFDDLSIGKIRVKYRNSQYVKIQFHSQIPKELEKYKTHASTVFIPIVEYEQYIPLLNYEEILVFSHYEEPFEDMMLRIMKDENA